MTIDDFIRPSATDANALCAGRPMMQAAVVGLLGEPPAADEAELGIEAHRWGEAGIRLLVQDTETLERLEQVRDIESAIAELRDAHAKQDPDLQLDAWTLNVVEQYVRFVFSLIVKHGIAPENVLVEERIDMRDLGFVNKGTSDCLLVIPYERLLVIDLKAGFIDQGDAAGHGQLAAYGCAASLRFRTKHVEVWIAQPRAEKPYRFTGARFDEETLRTTAAWVSDVNRRCRAPDPDLTAGYAQCVHCKALTRCPAAREYFMRASEALEAIGQPADPDAWGELIGAAKIAEKWADQVKEQGKAHITAGGDATGWKLGTPRAMRTIAQVPAALQKLADAGMGEMAAAALSMSASKLPPEALAIVAEFVTEKLSDPPLTADKRGGKATAA